jgi:hypothetical protein
VWIAWNAQERSGRICHHTGAELAVAWLAEKAREIADESMPAERRNLAAVTRSQGSHRSDQPTAQAHQARTVRTAGPRALLQTFALLRPGAKWVKPQATHMTTNHINGAELHLVSNWIESNDQQIFQSMKALVVPDGKIVCRNEALIQLRV